MTEPLDIILSTHDHLGLTIQCVEALYANTGVEFKLTIVDDSTDMTEAWLAEFGKTHNINYIRCPSEELTCMNDILNIALKHTKSEFVVYLGNSVKVEPDWLIPAIRGIQQYEDVGCIGFKCLFETGVIEHAGVFFEPGMPHHMNYGVGEGGHRHTYMREVDIVGWCLVLLRRKALPIDGLSNDYYIGFRGYDDIDNCLQMRKKGWKILYCGYGACYHWARATRLTSNQAEQEKFAQEYEENRFRFLARWGTPPLEGESESPPDSI